MIGRKSNNSFFFHSGLEKTRSLLNSCWLGYFAGSLSVPSYLLFLCSYLHLCLLAFSSLESSRKKNNSLKKPITFTFLAYPCSFNHTSILSLKEIVSSPNIYYGHAYAHWGGSAGLIMTGLSSWPEQVIQKSPHPSTHLHMY